MTAGSAFKRVMDRLNRYGTLLAGQRSIGAQFRSGCYSAATDELYEYVFHVGA